MITTQTEIKAEIYTLIEQFPHTYLPNLLSLLQQLLKFLSPITTNGFSPSLPLTQVQAIDILDNNTDWAEFEQEMSTIRSKANVEDYEFIHS